MAIELRMLKPDFLRHLDWLNVERSRLKELEALIVARPFDLDRMIKQILALAQHAAERRRLTGRQARLARQLLGHRLAGNLAAVTASVAMIFPAGFDLAHETLPAQHDAVRH